MSLSLGLNVVGRKMNKNKMRQIQLKLNQRFQIHNSNWSFSNEQKNANHDAIEKKWGVEL